MLNALHVMLLLSIKEFHVIPKKLVLFLSFLMFNCKQLVFPIPFFWKFQKFHNISANFFISYIIFEVFTIYVSRWIFLKVCSLWSLFFYLFASFGIEKFVEQTQFFRNSKLAKSWVLDMIFFLTSGYTSIFFWLANAVFCYSKKLWQLNTTANSKILSEELNLTEDNFLC